MVSKNSANKTKEQLMKENAELSRKVAELEKVKSNSISVQEQLRIQQIEHQIMFDMAPACVWYLDRAGRVLRVNKTAAATVGIPVKDIVGKFVDKLLPSDEAHIIMAHIQEVIDSGKPRIEVIEEHTLLSGKKRWTRSDKIPYYGDTGELLGIIVFIADITELKKIQDALQESKEMFDLFMELNPICVFFKDENIRPICLSKNYETMLNMPLDQILGKTMDELFPSDLAKSMIEDDRKVLNGQKLVEIQEELNGRYYRTLKFPIIRRDKPTLLAGFTMDITRQKEAEEALRISQSRLTEAMDLANIVYWEVDPASNEYIFNDPFYAFHGTTAEKEGGYRMTREEYFKRFVHPDDRSNVFQIVAQRISAPEFGILPDLEHRIIRRDGEVRHILVRARAVKDNSGRIIKRYGVSQDITDRKQSETRLFESERRYRTVFENTGAATIIIENDTTISLCNTEFERLSGYTKNEIEGKKSWTEFVSKEDLERMLTSHHLRRKNPDTTLVQYEFRFVRRTGELRDMYLVVDMIPDTDKSVTSLIDITELKRAEQEKTRLETQLHQARKMEAIGTLAGGIAHDFNNILTSLVGYAALLKMKTDDRTLSSYVDRILSASNKATDLIQSLLAFSRQQAINLKPLNINSTIEKTEKLLERIVAEDIVIKTRLAEEDITIMADITQIDQILFNLTSNARDAMPQGGTLTIETKIVKLSSKFRRLHGYGELGKYVLLTVSDMGVGMDAATQKRIFDPFFTTKEVGKGTGLGLATVYGVVKQHGGHITVCSEPGKGTTFCIYFPVVDKILKEYDEAPVSMEGGNETILVAEDNDAVRDLIREVLTEYGYSVIEATDGAEAVKQFKKKADTIDLLIFDSLMPVQNGREAYDEIHKIKPDIRVIFTSGHTRDVFLDKGIEDRQFSFLQKPISPDALLRKIREVLDNGQDPH
jgi:two-component system, cell cycle sensor histidine kinase and response regulator CckA